MDEDETLGPISLRWDGDRVDGVFVAADWRQTLTPTELISGVVTQFRARRATATGTWRSRVRLRGIPLDQMSEFVDAIRAARRESPMPQRTERNTSHFRSVWRGGGLLTLAADTDWLAADAKRQQIADELLQILDVPPDQDGPAVSWLMRMMGEQDR